PPLSTPPLPDALPILVTLAFAQLVFYMANEWRDLTGGENGLHGVPRTFPGLSLGRSGDFYYAALPLIVLGYAFAYRIVHSPFGRSEEHTSELQSRGHL